MDEEDVRRFLEALGKALSEGDAPGAARSWEVPGFVLSDEGVLAVSDPGEIEAFFGSGSP